MPEVRASTAVMPVVILRAMPAERNRTKRENFNLSAPLPFQLRLEDFEIAMQDVYDLFYDDRWRLRMKNWCGILNFLQCLISTIRVLR